MPILLLGSETMVWREKEGFTVRVVQMDNLRGLSGFRRINRIANTRVRELGGVTKEVDERIVWPF